MFMQAGIPNADTEVAVPSVPDDCLPETKAALMALDTFLNDLGKALAYEQWL